MQHLGPPMCSMSFQPICVLCLSDCDRGGGVTSCSHYFCSRCVARLPTAAPCPLCQRPYQLIQLDHPNVQQLMQDGATALGRTEKIISSQVRHYQQIIRRMRQALAMLHSQHQDMTRQHQQRHAQCAAAMSQSQALEVEVCRLREELAHVTAVAAQTSVQRMVSQQQPTPPPPPRQQQAHMLANPRATLAHGGRTDGAPKTVADCHTPSGQIIAPPSAARLPPFAPPDAAGANAPDTSPRGSWPHSSRAVLSSPSRHSHGPHRPHYSSGNGGEARGVAVREAATSSAAEAAPPLGWSASSLIAKRHRPNSDPGLLRRRVDDSCALLAQPAAGLGADCASVALTPRSHAMASLQQRPPRQSNHAAARGSENSGLGDSAGPNADFRLSTPLADALQQQQQSLRPGAFSRAAASYMQRPSPKPLQRLFSSPRSGPRAF
ncbi:hypothetical protein LSCM1_05835 [Leishmania martiniquensis]|uniref:RING-type domain-containing protein n=1 Tax=Leishmania martiniquensis TaxID=1580590 RepID=A0A836H3B2_9TRYP|nr:hypothetical protein LSCM1_05835 [Leishmania martiniquensis]